MVAPWINIQQLSRNDIELQEGPKINIDSYNATNLSITNSFDGGVSSFTSYPNTDNMVDKK